MTTGLTAPKLFSSWSQPTPWGTHCHLPLGISQCGLELQAGCQEASQHTGSTQFSVLPTLLLDDFYQGET